MSMRTNCFRLPVILLGVEMLMISSKTAWAVVKEGLTDRSRAPTPVTWGVAIEVPEMVLVEEAPLIQAEVMPTPGAMISTQVPYEEKEAKRSDESEAATVKARLAPAGDAPRRQPGAFGPALHPRHHLPRRGLTSRRTFSFTDPAAMTATGGGPATAGAARRHGRNGMARHDFDPEGKRLPIKIDRTSNGEYAPPLLTPGAR